MRIAAGAFGDALPTRDLVVSPGHGVFVRNDAGEHLIPAVYLIDGQTIVQEGVAEVEYVHVELDRHDILLAEGLGRKAISTSATAPSSKTPACRWCCTRPLRRWRTRRRAPFVIAGPVLERVRAKLAARAEPTRGNVPSRSRRRG